MAKGENHESLCRISAEIRSNRWSTCPETDVHGQFCCRVFSRRMHHRLYHIWAVHRLRASRPPCIPLHTRFCIIREFRQRASPDAALVVRRKITMGARSGEFIHSTRSRMRQFYSDFPGPSYNRTYNRNHRLADVQCFYSIVFGEPLRVRDISLRTQTGSAYKFLTPSISSGRHLEYVVRPGPKPSSHPSVTVRISSHWTKRIRSRKFLFPVQKNASLHAR